jgi:hypothetical protein
MVLILLAATYIQAKLCFAWLGFAFALCKQLPNFYKLAKAW